MARIDGQDEAFRGLTEEARRADLARRAEEAAAWAAQLAAELQKALDPAHPQGAEETARILVEANRLPREAQRAFFVAAGGNRAAADPAEPLRRRIAESFPEGSEKRLSLAAALARHQGAEPRQMSRTALEAAAARTIAKLGSVRSLSASRLVSPLSGDVVERARPKTRSPSLY